MEPGPTGSSAAAGGAQATIFIKTLTGRLGAVDVRWDDTGADLKRKVIEENIHQGDVDRFRLIFAGTQLEDARSLRHQGVTNHCTVQVVLRLRGGGGISSLHPVSDFPAVTAQGRKEAQPHSSSPDKTEPEEQRPIQILHKLNAKRAVAELRNSTLPKENCKLCISKILPEVTPEIVPGTEENRTVYRAHIPSAGSFHCSETGLGFEVSAAVTVEYEYGSWAESLSPSARQEWMVASPLFRIRAEPDTVRAVHLPHFVCLAGRAETGSHWARCWSQGLMVALSHSLQPVGLGGYSSSSSSWSTGECGPQGPLCAGPSAPLPAPAPARLHHKGGLCLALLWGAGS
ncbi:olfactory receptor 5F1-like [Platysternon megacephalum]|uniref:Olfactory receptor 5F1-like n=1 Tax=Platysternon megacephalum TaxID=55544 RepID=A0A4D9DQK4_9SAUR|nr:olfactory receptor 5F1-like [Platysternon megacephalum]